MKKIIVPISGLHCPACELRSEGELKKINNVVRVNVSHKKGEAEIEYQGQAPGAEEIRRAVECAGYRLAEAGEKKPQNTLLSSAGLILVVAAGYWLLTKSSLLNLGALLGEKEFSLFIALLIGLVAGLSTCLALVGSLILSLAANYAKNNPDAGRSEKIDLQVRFQFGRILGFIALGGLLGFLGSSFKLSPLLNGAINLAVGAIILLLGLKMLKMFPLIEKLSFSLPKRFAPKNNNAGPFWLGVISFFLPCGFTQSMQVYALASGKFIDGALIMGLFAIGTMPGLFGIGSLASLINKRSSAVAFRAVGALIIIFALFNLQNGWNLIKTTAWKGQYEGSKIEALKNDSEIQIIRMAETNRGYSPNRLTVKSGRAVRWIIDGQAPYSCAAAFIVPSLNISRQLQKGENIIEFTPEKPGTIPFSCSMGMYTGEIIVE